MAIEIFRHIKRIFSTYVSKIEVSIIGLIGSGEYKHSTEHFMLTNMAIVFFLKLFHVQLIKSPLA